jgi:hypothetical protein
MTLNLTTVARRTANTGLVVLFPGFVLYHYVIAQHWLPPVLGGLFGIGSTLVAAIAIALIPWIVGRQLGGALGQGLFAAGMIGYLTLWTVINFVFVAGEAYATPAARQSLSTVLIWISLMFIGTFCVIERRPWTMALRVGGILIVLALLHSMVHFRSPLGPYLAFVANEEDSQFSTYQAIGRSIVVTSVCIAALTKRNRAKFLVFAAGTVALLLVGSRSDFFSLALLTAAVAARALYERRATLWAPVGIGAVLVMGLALWPLFLQSRSAEVLDLSQSSSWQARRELQLSAIRVIETNPVFGDFGYYLRESGAGAYPHNALSAWTNFGFLGFVLYLSVIAYFAALSVMRWLRGSTHDPTWFAAAQINVVALIQALVASPVFAVIPALGWGLALNALRRERAARTVTSAARPAGALPVGG